MIRPRTKIPAGMEGADTGMEGAQIDTEAIEERAGQVLAEVPSYIWDGDSLPVPVEDIADSVFGLFVRDVEDMTAAPGCPPLEPGNSLSGLLLASTGEIWVNAEEARQWPPRRRFTIGHELGHWVLHRSGQQSLFCRRLTVDPDETRPGETRPAETRPEETRSADTRPPLPVTEEEANMFAAALLMPAELIRRHYTDCGGDFGEMCDRFDSSGAAMGRRLHQAVPRSA